jgi:hypothetical protein
MTVWLWIALVSNLAFWGSLFFLLVRRRSDVTVTHERNQTTPQSERDRLASRFSYYCGSPLRQLNSFRRRDSL